MPLHNHFFVYTNDLVDHQDNAPDPRPLPDSSLSALPSQETQALLSSRASSQSFSQTTQASSKSETRTLVYACLLTTLFFFVELVGGYIAGSLAIMSDAAHLLSDLAGFLISLIAVSVAHLPANAQMSFGFARAEVLGAFVSILFIWALTAVLVYIAIVRLFNPRPINGPIMLVLGVIGLFVNIILGCVLGHGHHGHSHGHSHSHSHNHNHNHVHDRSHVHDDSHVHSHSHANAHQSADHSASHACDSISIPDDVATYQSQEPHLSSHESQSKFDFLSVLFRNDIKSVNLRAAYLHVLGDTLQSVGVIVAAVTVTLYPTWTFVDPLCTVLFAIIVIMTTKELAAETMTVLMEGTPASLRLEDIHSCLMRIKGVSRVCDLHVWSITPRRPALSVHLKRKDGFTAHEVLKETKMVLANQFGIFHATIQVNCETSECCDDNVYFEMDSNQKNCMSHDALIAPSPSFV